MYSLNNRWNVDNNLAKGILLFNLGIYELPIAT